MTGYAGGEPRDDLDTELASSSRGQTSLPGRWPRQQRPLLDRDVERTGIDDLLDLVLHGFSGVLMLRGGHGVGKTTLVDYAVRAASGFRISAIAGVESEISLQYGAVHQLLIPFLPLIDDLPVPQRQAIRVAFGLQAGAPQDRFLVGLACLTLVSRAATDQPVLCAIDDAHWIDAESALVLGFVARRLYADRVGMIVTVSDTDLIATAECTMPDLIEAAVRSDNREVAVSTFAILAGRTLTAGTPWALGLRARYQALLADRNDAEGAYVEAISQLGRSHAKFDLARTHLLYGQ